MLEKLVESLCDEFEIVVYSQSQVNQGYRQLNFIIKSAPAKINSRIIRWLYLFTFFLKDHFRNKFRLMFAFWGYPTGFLATCASKVVGVPSVIYILGSDSAGIPAINFGIFHKPVQRKLALWAYRQTSLLLVISEFQRKKLIGLGLAKPVTVLPWGAPADLYRFIVKVPTSVLHVIHVGHMTPVKDQATLLRAFSLVVKHYPAELRIFGVDNMKGAIKKLCVDLKLEKEVHFFDMVPYSQMAQQYAWADLMLHTSLFEGQSMALTEAAASGVLLAGTKVGLLHDLGDACGITVEVGDFEGLAVKVLDIIKHPDLWKQKIHNAGQWAAAHDLSWTVKELKMLLRAI